MSESEKPLLESYWIEIPCADFEAAQRLADHLRAFAPRITSHKLVQQDDERVTLIREPAWRLDEDGYLRQT